jgi:hypothetical protein
MKCPHYLPTSITFEVGKHQIGDDKSSLWRPVCSTTVGSAAWRVLTTISIGLSSFAMLGSTILSSFFSAYTGELGCALTTCSVISDSGVKSLCWTGAGSFSERGVSLCSIAPAVAFRVASTVVSASISSFCYDPISGSGDADGCGVGRATGRR